MRSNQSINKNPLQPLKANQAIGVLDSGVGGISVLKHIHALLPHENLIYVADSKYAPYGSKTPAEITERCFAIADFLISKNVKALVVACNTATAAAIDAMREKYSHSINIPIIGMEPAVKQMCIRDRPLRMPTGKRGQPCYKRTQHPKNAEENPVKNLLLQAHQARMPHEKSICCTGKQFEQPCSASAKRTHRHQPHSQHATR